MATTTANLMPSAMYNRYALMCEGAGLLSALTETADMHVGRRRLMNRINQVCNATCSRDKLTAAESSRARDCCRALTSMLQARSDALAGFSVAGALSDVTIGRTRNDLTPAFYAELIHMIRAIKGGAPSRCLGDGRISDDIAGRPAALLRSHQLDELWHNVQSVMDRYPHGLQPETIARRSSRKEHILAAMGGSQSQWGDWKWHVEHIITNAEDFSRTTAMSADERSNIDRARAARLPFAVTPYYASLMDDTGSADRAIRAQVIPSGNYVHHMEVHRGDKNTACDFMLESDTSPIDLVTRRYPAIAILKPYNSCPQICVYCQRNWEIEQAMSPEAYTEQAKIDAAIDWIAQHPSISEVLITGGDPLMLSDGALKRILDRLAAIDSVDIIRIGTRTPVTLPMRITDELAELLGSYRRLGRRDIAVVTHVEHPYEITMDLAAAVDRLRRQGIGVYNQQVFTFYVSRRFETSLLRMLLRRVGIDPYYTFAPKGKQETADFRVPLARILQERKEEARLLPGLRRTDEPVYNIPGLGKNYLRAGQHHDLISIHPDGARVYEFHPWEKNVMQCNSRVAADVPILHYLQRLAAIGEDATDYDSIWYYF